MGCENGEVSLERTLSGESEIPVKNVKLIIIPKNDEGGEFLLGESSSVILGRDTSCGLVLKGRMISRQHAVIEKRDDGYFLKDTNSYNGTYLNSTRVSELKKLANGDEIRIANRVLKFIETTREFSEDTDTFSSDDKSPDLAITSVDSMDISITSDDFDSLWSGLVEEKNPENAAIENPSIEQAQEQPQKQAQEQKEEVAEEQENALAPSLSDALLDIPPELIAEATSGGEEEKKLAELRKLARQSKMLNEPGLLLTGLKDYLREYWRNPVILEYLEVFSGSRTIAVLKDGDRQLLEDIIATLDKNKPDWVLEARYKSLKLEFKR